jgi:hypothetical protein
MSVGASEKKPSKWKDPVFMREYRTRKSREWREANRDRCKDQNRDSKFRRRLHKLLEIAAHNGFITIEICRTAMIQLARNTGTQRLAREAKLGSEKYPDEETLPGHCRRCGILLSPNHFSSIENICDECEPHVLLIE